MSRHPWLFLCVLLYLAPGVWGQVEISVGGEKSVPLDGRSVHEYVINDNKGKDLKIEVKFNRWNAHGCSLYVRDRFLPTSSSYDKADTSGKRSITKNVKVYTVKHQATQGEKTYIRLEDLGSSSTVERYTLKVSVIFPVWAIILIVLCSTALIGFLMWLVGRRSWKRAKVTDDEIVMVSYFSIGELLAFILILSMGLPFLIVGILVEILTPIFVPIGALSIVIPLFFCGPVIITLNTETYERRSLFFFVFPLSKQVIPTGDIREFGVSYSRTSKGHMVMSQTIILKNGTRKNLGVGATNLRVNSRQEQVAKLNEFLKKHDLGDFTQPAAPMMTAFAISPQQMMMMQGLGAGPAPVTISIPPPNGGQLPGEPIAVQPPASYGYNPSQAAGGGGTGPPPPPLQREFEPGQKHAHPVQAQARAPDVTTKFWVEYQGERDQVLCAVTGIIADLREAVKDRLGIAAPAIKIHLCAPTPSERIPLNEGLPRFLAQNSYDTPIYVDVAQ